MRCFRRPCSWNSSPWSAVSTMIVESAMPRAANAGRRRRAERRGRRVGVVRVHVVEVGEEAGPAVPLEPGEEARVDRGGGRPVVPGTIPAELDEGLEAARQVGRARDEGAR